ncbi:hypothetical protein QZH46_08880 [Pseudomonas corrugata]
MNNNKQPALLSVNQLHKTFATRDGLTTAIDHISLEVQVGETVALVGNPDVAKVRWPRPCSACCRPIVGKFWSKVGRCPLMPGRGAGA